MLFELNDQLEMSARAALVWFSEHRTEKQTSVIWKPYLGGRFLFSFFFLNVWQYLNVHFFILQLTCKINYSNRVTLSISYWFSLEINRFWNQPSRKSLMGTLTQLYQTSNSLLLTQTSLTRTLSWSYRKQNLLLINIIKIVKPHQII